MAPPTMVLQPVPRHVTCDTCHYLCHNPYEDAKTYVHNPCEDACQEPYMTCIIACEMMRATTPYHSAMPRAKTCDACSHPCQAIRARHAMTHPMVARPVLRNVIRGHNHCHGAWPEKTQHVPPPVPWGTPICHGATTHVKKNMMCAKMSRPLPWCVAMVQHTMRHATAHAMTRGMTPATARSKKRDACHGHYPHLTCHRPCHQACGRHNAHARTHDAAHATFTYVMVA